MAQSITEQIFKTLEETFFGEEFFKYNAIVDNVLGCRALKDFRRLKLDFKSPEFELVFSAANHKPEDKNSMTQQRAEQIYNQVKAVKSASTFI